MALYDSLYPGTGQRVGDGLAYSFLGDMYLFEPGEPTWPITPTVPYDNTKWHVMFVSGGGTVLHYFAEGDVFNCSTGALNTFFALEGVATWTFINVPSAL